jgi:hypothetical protein
MSDILELARERIRIPSVNPMGGPDDNPIYSENKAFIKSFMESLEYLP